jgi:hypothetical protein
METSSYRKGPHPTSRDRGRCMRQVTVIMAGLLSQGSPSLKLLPVSAYSCGICFLRAWSLSAVPLAGSCFHLPFSQKGPFIAHLMRQIYDPHNSECKFKRAVLYTNYQPELLTIVNKI